MNACQYRKLHNRQKGECTWCGGPVGKGRRRWCSQACVDHYRERYDWQYARRKVFQRDRGVCAECGVDCEKIRRIVRLVRWGQDGWETYGMLRAFYRALGWDNLLAMDLWQADHIVPRCRGGGNELENLRTLCVPCHKAETSRLAGERTRERKVKMEARP